MAGHSKWANTKHRKARQDAKKGKIFTKLIRIITIAAKSGGDPETNPVLKNAIIKARSENMTNDTINKAIAKGSGSTDTDNYFEITYEGYGPGGIALLVSALTDNKNRTASEMRYIFSRNNGNLAASGAVSHMFERKGIIEIPIENSQEDALMELVLENGGEDMLTHEEVFEIKTDPKDFTSVLNAIEEAQINYTKAEVTMVPKANTPIIDVTEPKIAQQILRLVDTLEDNDDVQDVFATFDISDPSILDE